MTDPKIQTVEVKLAERSYQILIGSGLIADIDKRLSPYLLNQSRIFTIIDEGIVDDHGKKLHQALAASRIEQFCRVLPSGEATKSWHRLQETVEWLIDQKVERHETVLAFGGGVVGDLVGFASAILRRGVNYIQMPTTLLAQVDSSVGGKTGINSPAGKNLIGAFHQPRLVLCDAELLQTLPRRDFLSGLAEVIKYGIICDDQFFLWLENNADKLNSENLDTMTVAIQRSCEIKARIVAADETELAGRAILNLGHTFAHALEAVMGYSGRLLHGEAVAIGCCLAMELSSRMKLCKRDEVRRVVSLFRSLGMKTSLHEIGGEGPDVMDILHHMQQDKKIVFGQPRFVLVRRIGDAFLSDQTNLSQVQGVLVDSLKTAPK